MSSKVSADDEPFSIADWPPVVGCSRSMTSSSGAGCSSSSAMDAAEKRLALYKHIGWALLLFNCLYTALLACIFPHFLRLLLDLWPFTVTYGLSMAASFVGIKWNWARLMWPMMLLKLPFVLVPVSICLLFLSQLTCQSMHSARNGSRLHFECPLWLSQRHNLSLGALEPLPIDIEEESPSLAGLFFLLAIALEKAAELVFFCRLMRRMGRLVEAVMAMEGPANGQGGDGDSDEKKQKRRPSNSKKRGIEIGREPGTGGEETADEQEEQEEDGEEEADEDTVYERPKKNGGGTGKAKKLPAQLKGALSLPSLPVGKRRVIA